MKAQFIFDNSKLPCVSFHGQPRRPKISLQWHENKDNACGLSSDPAELNVARVGEDATEAIMCASL